MRRYGEYGEPRARAVKPRTAFILAALAATGIAIGLATTAGATSSQRARAGGDAAVVPKGVAEAKRIVAQAKKFSVWVAPGPKFNARAASGKTAYFVANNLAVPFNATVLAGVNSALTQAGVKVIALDNKGQISETVRLIEQGIAQHVDLMILPSTPAQLLAAPLRDAKAAGIQVIQRFSSDSRLPNAAERDLGVSAIVSYCFKCAGKLQADFAIADSNGKVNAMVYWDSDVGTGQPQIDGIRDELARLCPKTCHATFKDLPISQWAQQIPTLTQTDVANRSFNYYMPVYDGMVDYMLPGIHAANAQNRVRIVTINGDKAQMVEMKNHDVVYANIGTPIEYAGWAMADQALRLMTGNRPVANAKIAFRLFDRTNIPNLDNPERTWYHVNFKLAYKKLWGLSR